MVGQRGVKVGFKELVTVGYEVGAVDGNPPTLNISCFDVPIRNMN